MKCRFLSAVAVVAATLLAYASAPHARAADPEVLEESWDELRLNGGPAGHIHTVVRRTGTATAPLIESTLTTHMEIARGPSTMVIDGVSATTERPDGSLVTLKETQNASGVETVKEV